MRRLIPFVFLAASWSCLQAQNFSSITIKTVPSGAAFLVDGLQYTQAANFNWPTGSQHTVVFVTDQGAATAVQTAPGGQTQYAFNGWVDNAGQLVPSAIPIQTVTASPNITSLTANLTVSYLVTLNLFNTFNPANPVSPPTCGAPGVNLSSQTYPGVVYIGATCYWASTSVFVVSGTPLNLNAIPFPGYVFTGWNFNTGTLNSYLTSITVNSPVTITPTFAQGKLVHFLTNPLGLNVLVDHTVVPTRTIGDVTTCPANEYLQIAPQLGFPGPCYGDFYFAQGSQHVIGAPSPVLGPNSQWLVFDSFSNGMTQNSIYTATNILSQDTITANFQPGAEVSLSTNPNGLQLSVDGRTNWPSYTFLWEIGSTHQISAPASTFGSNGRQYTFQNWSNGGSAAQTMTIDQNAVNNGVRAIATYSILDRVVIQSAPSAQTIQVDGTSCQTPCTLDRQSGATMQVTAPTQIPQGVGARLDFASWSDGGASNHSFVVNQDYTTLTLSYTTSYQLSASSSPAGGDTFQVSPASSDMFFPQNTPVTVTATPNPGFKFQRWTGDLTGTYPSGSVSMSVPRAVVAQMITVPYIAPTGVMNAVGVTPSSSVGPGSIMSIYGQGLAGNLVAGSTSPLSQSLGSVTVTVNDQILGLMFVSPQQINAQVPSSLADGQYTLDVHVSGQPDVTTTFTIARDSPGLFVSTVNSQQYAVAFHADGSAVTTDSPAAAGETISVLGTGFGPYQSPVEDGYAASSPAPALVDSVSVSLGGQNLSPSWAGAAAGFVGSTLTNFQVPTGLPSGAAAPLTLTVNGVSSNMVLLPIQ